MMQLWCCVLMNITTGLLRGYGWRALRALISRFVDVLTVKLAMDRPLTFEPTNALPKRAQKATWAYILAHLPFSLIHCLPPLVSFLAFNW